MKKYEVLLLLKEGKTEDEIKRIQSLINKLEKELDRLDSTGDYDKSNLIKKKLAVLRNKLPVSKERSKELFKILRQSIT